MKGQHWVLRYLPELLYSLLIIVVAIVETTIYFTTDCEAPCFNGLIVMGVTLPASLAILALPGIGAIAGICLMTMAGLLQMLLISSAVRLTGKALGRRRPP